MSKIPADIWEAAENAFDNMLCNCKESSGGSAELRKDSITDLAMAIVAELATKDAEIARLQAKNGTIARLSAENERMREAIDYYEIGVSAVGVPNAAERKVLHDCVAKAREIRATLSPIPDPAGGMPLEVK
jgi:hypothetical protein